MIEGTKLNQVMIVDDESDLRELVRTSLEREGYKVLEAGDGEECLEILEDESPDLILLDINMPGLNGWETLEQMDAQGITSEVPVAMFTIEELTFVKMLRQKMERLVGYIEKPFKRDELLEMVEEIINKTKKVYQLKDKIEQSPEDGKLAKAFLEWNQTQMIHERLLEKLKLMKKNFKEKQKLAHAKNLIKGEKQTIEEAKRKKKDILNSAGLENLETEIGTPSKKKENENIENGQ